MPLEIVTVPCLRDNYAFLAHDGVTGETAVVDVPEHGPILAALAGRGWKASVILSIGPFLCLAMTRSASPARSEASL